MPNTLALTVGAGGSAPARFNWNPVTDLQRAPLTLRTDEAVFANQIGTDPVIILGYNSTVGGAEINANEGLAVLQIEGNFLSSPTKPAASLTLSGNTVGATITATASAGVFAAADVTTESSIQDGTGFALITAFTSATVVSAVVRKSFASTSLASGAWAKGLLVMEMFLQSGQGGAVGSRPFFSWYNKGSRKVESMDFSVGLSKNVNFRFENQVGGASTATYQLTENSFFWYAPTTSPAANKILFIDSHAGFGTLFNFFADGDSSGSSGDGAGQIVYTFTGSAGSTSRRLTFVCGGAEAMNIITAAAGATARIGIGLQSTFGRFSIDANTAFLSESTFLIYGSTSRSRGEIEITHNGGVTLGWRLRARGYVEVQGAGAIVGPSTGAQAVTTPTFTNKPGATTPTGNPAAWIPHLTTAGVVVWSPAWAD